VGFIPLLDVIKQQALGAAWNIFIEVIETFTKK
jgi:hypothetical protein